jgi:peptide/nickel transport system substrate-binding protein
MDELLEKAKAAATEAERKELYKQVTQLSLDDMGQVPLVNGWLLIAHTNKLQNYKPMRTGFLKTLKDAWFEG